MQKKLWRAMMAPFDQKHGHDAMRNITAIYKVYQNALAPTCKDSDGEIARPGALAAIGVTARQKADIGLLALVHSDQADRKAKKFGYFNQLLPGRSAQGRLRYAITAS
jgi:hypothetical protein